MEADELRALQAPIKKEYKSNPEEAQWTLHAEGSLNEDITCTVKTDIGSVETGLHPATGGDGSQACSGDMLLEALVGCAGVTLKSVATAMDIDIKSGTVKAEGDLDFRGTLGVSREVPVGFKEIRLKFELDVDEDKEELLKLVELTERYCVVYQTLKNGLNLNSNLTIN